VSESTSNEGSATTDGNALPNRDPPDVTRFKAAAAKRVQAHRRRRRMGLRCLTVRVNNRVVRHLISTGYLAPESTGDRRRSRSLLRPGFTTMSPEQAERRSLCRAAYGRLPRECNALQAAFLRN
jgi:hypothetical protein